MTEQKRYYAGIGSRQTPEPILKVMEQIGKFLAERGWILRSGGADGADSAFERGCDAGQGKKEIYLPWKGFNNNSSDLFLKSHHLKGTKEKAFEIASQYHPVWEQLSYGAQCLMARNVYQVLGQDLATPVSMVICYNLGGFTHGGTSQAMRIARDRAIPIFRLNDEEELVRIKIHLARGLDFLESLQYNLFEEECA
jgi:hypothetical protein